MNKTLLACCLCLLLALQAKSQTVKDILKDKKIPLTFYGVDFTHAKLIGDANARPSDIVNRQYAGINDLLVKESSKYDIAEALHRKSVKYDPSFVAVRNAQIDSNTIVSVNPKDYGNLTAGATGREIAKFETANEPGYGVLLMVDGMYKSREMMSAWFVVFNNATKEILLSERHEGKVGMAFSFRNYWASGLKNIIKSIADKYN